MTSGNLAELARKARKELVMSWQTAKLEEENHQLKRELDTPRRILYEKKRFGLRGGVPEVKLQCFRGFHLRIHGL